MMEFVSIWLLVVGIVTAITAAVLFVFYFNWGALLGLKTIEYHELQRIGHFYRFIESIEGPLQINKTRKIIGSVCHITFFPCDVKILGRFALCYTSTDGKHYVRQGCHWRGNCTCLSDIEMDAEAGTNAG